MPNRKSPRKNVGSAFETSIQVGINKRKNAGKQIGQYKPVRYKKLREFYHSQSNRSFSIAENANLIDSEDEFQSLDIQTHRKIIDENPQLSIKQKSIMNLWNEFVEKSNPFSVKHMKTACKLFIDNHIDEIRQQKLYNHLMMHLFSLHNGDLLMQKDLWSLIGHLQMHLGIQQFSGSMSNPKNHQSNAQENRNQKRKHSSSTSADGLERKQRYSLRATN